MELRAVLTERIAAQAKRGGSGWLDSLGPFLSGVWRIADYATLCRIVRWS